MNNLIIAVLAGTTRQERKSIHAAQYVATVGRSIEGVEIVFVDPAELVLPGDGNDLESKDPRYSDITARADAFFIVSPEYNHSFPGSLKRMLDSELKNYIHKPVAFAGVSAGHWGGLRAVEALVGTVREMGMVATFTDVYFPSVNATFDDNGAIKPELETDVKKGVKASFDELIWMANALKAARHKDKI